MSSALIGGFTVRLNVELFSDWLFHSAAHFSCSQQEGNTGRKIYISILSLAVYRRVIIRYIKCGHQGAAINQGCDFSVFFSVFSLFSNL